MRRLRRRRGRRGAPVGLESGASDLEKYLEGIEQSRTCSRKTRRPPPPTQTLPRFKEDSMSLEKYTRCSPQPDPPNGSEERLPRLAKAGTPTASRTTRACNRRRGEAQEINESYERQLPRVQPPRGAGPTARRVTPPPPRRSARWPTPDFTPSSHAARRARRRARRSGRLRRGRVVPHIFCVFRFLNSKRLPAVFSPQTASRRPTNDVRKRSRTRRARGEKSGWQTAARGRERGSRRRRRHHALGRAPIGLRIQSTPDRQPHD